MSQRCTLSNRYTQLFLPFLAFWRAIQTYCRAVIHGIRTEIPRAHTFNSPQISYILTIIPGPEGATFLNLNNELASAGDIDIGELEREIRAETANARGEARSSTERKRTPESDAADSTR